ncbi:glycosyltransferase family 2 protein [Varibaculum prostatecancerukia]|uniref:glycosyltransferase family 2 protein n=1 Tax=Varibaculum prostatecancerukia TaxID=2811781 RepID=UPI001C005BFD|nr:glycosyltransferase family 2 protein [Varibaculum prostatecancerukia]
MRLSVIIPYYNSAEFLPRLEKTLSNQINPRGEAETEVEVIVVDDASRQADQTLLAEVSARNNWQLVTLTENLGPGGARNAGISAASGDYLVFLDSDDELIPGSLEILADALSKTPCDVLLFDFSIIDEGKAHDYTVLPEPPAQLDYVSTDYALAFARGGTCGKVYRRDFVREHDLGFGTGVRHEDTVLTKTALAWAEKVAYLPQSLYRYQVHAGSLIADDSNASLSASFEALEQIRKLSADRHPQEIEYVYIVEVIISCAMKFYPLKVTRSQARKLFLRFVADYPNWAKNPYLQKGGIRYRLYAALAQHHSFLGLFTLSYVETVMRKILGRGH